jgi:2-isopropylmalate synthase
MSPHSPDRRAVNPHTHAAADGAHRLVRRYMTPPATHPAAQTHNASLEEVVMALHTRPELFAGAHTRIDTTQLTRASRLLQQCTGTYVAPNKSIVGTNAFSHEAGIHQEGVLKHRATYEIMTPESVGADGSMLVLGKHSGRHALKQRFGEMGHELDDEHFLEVFARFKELCDRKKVVEDRDLAALAMGASC